MIVRRLTAFWIACLIGLGCFCPALALPYYTVDFESVKLQARDTVAWLYQPGTDLNMPLVYSPSDSYYLSRRYDERGSSNGTIFLTGEEQPDFSAPVIVLRGNNCLDYSMFGALSEYKHENFYRERPTLYIITPDANYRLDIFAGIKTRHADHTSWMVSDDSGERMRALEDILAQSYVKPDEQFLPEHGDAWAILTTESSNDSGSRFVLYARKRPIERGDEPAVDLVKAEMDERETHNGWYTVEGVGTWMIYGQNDPSWKRLIFETANSSRRRPFGDGGCGPTALAAAIANLVPKEELGRIADYAASAYGYRFCPCSINENFCSGLHQRYHIRTPDEYLRYFPLVVGSFAAGNNILGVQGRRDSWGTNMSYLEAFCSIWELPVTSTTDKAEAIRFLQEGRGMAVSCTVKTSPFTSSSHFITLAGADETHLYVIDPLRREQYGELDPYHLLSVVTPGLVKIKLEDAINVPMYPIYLIERK